LFITHIFRYVIYRPTTLQPVCRACTGDSALPLSNNCEINFGQKHANPPGGVIWRTSGAIASAQPVEFKLYHDPLPDSYLLYCV